MSAITTSFLLLLASTFDWQRVHAMATHVGPNFGIYGGNPIKITEVPYMAIFRPIGETWNCGAAIVHEQFLVTAAHCGGEDPSKFEVAVGIDDVSKGGTTYQIDKVFHHPKYWINFTAGIDYDVSVIKLKEKMEFSDRVGRIYLADSTLKPKSGDLLQTVGFGLTEEKLPSKQLLMVKLPFVELETCAKVYSQWENGWQHVTERMICAGGQLGKGDCNGDSGGPLTYKDQLIGVVSWSHKPCAESGWPNVFSDIPSMRDFIEEVIRNNA